MQLYIMRHGEARHQAISDIQRELTEYGISEVSDIANTIQDEVFDAVIVSPFVRAKQTANVVVGLLKNQTAVIECSDITPCGNAGQVHDYIDALLAEFNYQKILIISHMPLISYLLAELTVDGHMPIFQTSAIAKVDYNTEKMKGEFVEMLCPFNVCDV